MNKDLNKNLPKSKETIKEHIQEEYNGLKENITESTQEEVEALATEVTEEIAQEFQELKADIHEEIENVKEELLEAKDSLIEGIKETTQNFLNSIFGDFKLFLAIFRTVGKWFIAPLSLNFTNLRASNKEKKEEGEYPRYFTDFRLMKSIFLLSLIFLVIEETTTEDADIDKYATQFVFFLFYVVMLFGFISGSWIWKKIVGIQTPNARVFISFLVYQYATIYMIQFIATAILGLRITTEEDDLGIYIAYLFPLIHTMYFYYKLMAHYQVRSFKSKVLAFTLAFVFLAVFLIIPGAVNEVLMLDGLEGGE